MTKLTIRIAAPRREFKIDLPTILQHKDIHDFIDWVKKYKEGGRALGEAIEALNDHQRKEYEDLFRENATILANTFPGCNNYSDGPGSCSMGVPYPLAPSYLASSDIKVPADYICQLGIAEMMDEYFGICYVPRRITQRFQDADIKQRLADAIRHQTAGPENLNTVFMGNATAQDLIDLYGRQQVKQWWRRVDEDHLRNLADSCPNLYDGLVEMFGGGLEEDEDTIGGPRPRVED
jgi:hypothetical protein